MPQLLKDLGDNLFQSQDSLSSICLTQVCPAYSVMTFTPFCFGWPSCRKLALFSSRQISFLKLCDFFKILSLSKVMIPIFFLSRLLLLELRLKKQQHTHHYKGDTFFFSINRCNKHHDIMKINYKYKCLLIIQSKTLI